MERNYFEFQPIKIFEKSNTAKSIILNNYSIHQINLKVVLCQLD